MEKKDLKELEKELIRVKTFTMVQAQLMKEILIEIKLLRRDIQSPLSTEMTLEKSKTKVN